MAAFTALSFLSLFLLLCGQIFSSPPAFLPSPHFVKHLSHTKYLFPPLMKSNDGTPASHLAARRWREEKRYLAT